MLARKKMLEYRILRKIVPYKSVEEMLEGFSGSTEDYTYSIELTGVSIDIPARINEKNSKMLVDLVNEKLKKLGYVTKKFRVGNSYSRVIIDPYLPFLKFGRNVGYFAFSEDTIHFFFRDSELKKVEVAETIEDIIKSLKKIGIVQDKI